MSVSAISTNPLVLDPTQTAPGGVTGNLQTLVSSFNTLGQSLQSGDLSGAQQAFTSLLQSVPSASGDSTAAPSATSSETNSAGADIAALGQALQSGNLPAAQQAFANLQQAVQSVGGGRHGGHHHHGAAAAAGGSGDASGASGATSGSASASSSSSTVVSETTTTNADGTLTVTSTYADGTTSTAVLPNPNPTYATNKLDPNNNGQQATLLAAQEQSKPV